MRAALRAKGWNVDIALNSLLQGYTAPPAPARAPAREIERGVQCYLISYKSNENWTFNAEKPVNKQYIVTKGSNKIELVPLNQGSEQFTFTDITELTSTELSGSSWKRQY